MLSRLTIPSATAHEDSVNKMWSAYMEEAEKYDERMSDAWKGDADGVLVFTGLFSATVAAFIVESYKKLSPDSGDQTVLLLEHISQQLAGFANNTFVPPATYSPPSPTASIICVNAMWVLSLVLSITSALSATLMQQWARRYIQLPQVPSVQAERARVRSYLYLGTLKYRMRYAVETTPTLLHLSVFLFFVGFVIFFFTIHKTVAIVLSISVGLFGVAYFTLTILPCIDHICPYRTPMSRICWYLWHTLLSFEAFFRRFLLKRLHGLLVPYNVGDVRTCPQRKLVEWFESSDSALHKHGKRLKDGFRKSIVQGALAAPVGVDLEALAWLFDLPALADRSKIEKFVESIPGETIVQLMYASIGSGSIPFRDHLHALLRSCAPGTVGLDEDARKRRLLACLEAIHHISKASIVPYEVTRSEAVLSDLRINFANIRLMRELWADSDPAIRVTARSICALLARRFLRRYPLTDSVLAWLHDVMGIPSNIIFDSFYDRAAVDRMNIDSFVHGVLSNQSGDLQNEQTFVETLVILTNAGSQTDLRRSIFETEISALVQRAEQNDHRLHEVVDKVRKISERVVPRTTAEPPISSN
ncbi:hypothetical protein BJV78DRAFT_342802 [Lactifluus subvellereus]|nr:hypothetical protein BJV78DRAFT_342802 [Lactifluus subvellereus]